MIDLSCLNIVIFPGSTCTLQTGEYYITDNLGISKVEGGSFVITPSLKSHFINKCTKNNGTVVDINAKLAEQDNQGNYIFTIRVGSEITSKFKYLVHNGNSVNIKTVTAYSLIGDNGKWIIRKDNKTNRWYISPANRPSMYFAGKDIINTPKSYILTDKKTDDVFSGLLINTLNETTKENNKRQRARLNPNTIYPNYTSMVPTTYDPLSYQPPASSNIPPASSSRPPASSNIPPASSNIPPASSSRPPVDNGDGNLVLPIVGGVLCLFFLIGLIVLLWALGVFDKKSGFGASRKRRARI